MAFCLAEGYPVISQIGSHRHQSGPNRPEIGSKSVQSSRPKEDFLQEKAHKSQELWAFCFVYPSIYIISYHSIMQKKYSLKRSTLYSCFLVIVLVFTLFEELKLRRYLLNNHITKFGIAGSLPNFLAPIILVFGSIVISKIKEPEKVLRKSAFFVLGLILYEVCQIFMSERTFDTMDVIASILGGLFAYLVFIGINYMVPEKTM